MNTLDYLPDAGAPNMKTIDLQDAVRTCEEISDRLNQHLETLSRQLDNCQYCRKNMECMGHMRLERLSEGECHFKEVG